MTARSNGELPAGGTRPSQPLVPAIVRAARILDFLATVRAEAGVSEIARSQGISKSTCFNILNTLAEYGLVTKDPNVLRYRLGPKLIELGHASRQGLSYRTALHRELEPLVTQLRVVCIVAQPLPNDQGFVIVDRVVPRRDIPIEVVSSAIGQVYPLFAPAIGGAYLAAKDDREVTRIVLSTETGVDPALINRLPEIRKLGYAISLSYFKEGVNAVAAAALDNHDQVGFILCLVGTEGDFPADVARTAGKRLSALTPQLSRNISSSMTVS